MKTNKRAAFWGTFFVSAGIVWFLEDFGVEIGTSLFFKLAPLFLVFIGASLLKISEIWKTAATVLAAILLALFLNSVIQTAKANCPFFYGPSRFWRFYKYDWDIRSSKSFSEFKLRSRKYDLQHSRSFSYDPFGD